MPDQEPSQNAVDVRRLLASRAMFWRPEYMAVSAWVEHLPFAFWLMEAHQPKTFVELGTHYGTSYFAFCQAAERLALDTCCFAVDTWRGDEHAGFYDDTVIKAVRAHNERAYSGMSRLVKSTFDDALQHFSDGSIDLLHIDGHHTYESVLHDFESWLPKLSDRAIVLLHDTNVRERNFGVFKLMEELETRYPTFQFSHGHGLAVVVVGKNQNETVRELLAAGRNPTAAREVREVFARLGRACSDASQIAVLRAHETATAKTIVNLKQQLADAAAAREKTKADLTTRTKERDDARRGIELAKDHGSAERGRLTAELHHFEQSREETARLRQQVESLLTEVKDRIVQEVSARTQAEFLREEREKSRMAQKEIEAELRKQRDLGFTVADLQKQIAELKKQLEDAAIRHREDEAKVHNLRNAAEGQAAALAEADTLRNEMRALQATLTERSAQADALRVEMATAIETHAAQTATLREAAKATADAKTALAEELRQQLTAAQHAHAAEADALRTEMTSMLDVHASLADDIREELRAAKDAHARELDALSSEAGAAAEMHAAQLETARHAFEDGREKLDALLAERNELSGQLSQTSAEVARRDAALEALGAERDALQGNVESRQAELAALTTALEEGRAAIAQLKAGNEKDNDEAERELAALTRKNSDLQKSIETRFREVETLTRALDAESGLGSHEKRTGVNLAEQKRRVQERLAKVGTVDRDLANRMQSNAGLAAMNERHIRRDRVKASVTALAARHRRLGFLPKRGTDARGLKAALISSGLFDPKWYLETYNDVAVNGVDPFEHYNRYGAAEGRNPSAHFSTNDYLNCKGGGDEVKGNPLIFYVLTEIDDSVY